MMEDPRNNQAKFFCDGCGIIFNSLGPLDVHKLTCSKSLEQRGNPSSFYAAWQGARRNGASSNPIDETEKILPPSQPLKDPEESRNAENSMGSQNTTTDTQTCQFCKKKLKSVRGLNTHLKNCKQNKYANNNQCQNRVQPSILTQDVNNVNLSGSSESDTVLENGSNLLGWGSHTDPELAILFKSIYEELVHWRKDLFKLPSGAAGKRYLQMKTQLIESWCEGKQPVCEVALKIVMVMPGILLQKPCKKTTAKQHTEYLNKRLNLWESGDFDTLLREARGIQERMKKNKHKFQDPDHINRIFTRHMLQGKVHAALRVLQKSSASGIAEMSEDTMRELEKLHPIAEQAAGITLIGGEIPYFDPVIFSNIDEASISKAALKTRGAAGPSGLDADGWRRMLVSKNFGKTGKDLRSALARMTRILCTQDIQINESENNLEAFIACRLIPLEKQPTGIRPIGIGEVLRRIVGKAVVGEIKDDIMESAGNLQLCAGQKAGCEAAAHAMREIFEEASTDAVLFVDASNAFNSMNRQALLHNIQYLCPAMSTYLRNCYKTAARLFVSGGREISSAEGTTQGDPLAMQGYGVGIMPLLSLLKAENPDVKHLAYADDIGGGSSLGNLRQWWDKMVEFGPYLGYFPKASKSWLVVKPEKLQDAELIFAGSGVQITTEGRKYLGGYVGTTAGAEKYVQELVGEWVEELTNLSKIAKAEPQASYSAFTAGFRHKITYYMRTIPNLEEVLKPLDEVIDRSFIPAIIEGHVLSSDDRKLLSLPVRLGGMGIPLFSEICQKEYEYSLKVTQLIRPRIVAQDHVFIPNQQAEKQIEAEIKKEREQCYATTLEDLRQRMPREKLRGNELAQMKGASAWLTALPLKEEGYVLSKREFFDAVMIRYMWEVKRLPSKCVCGQGFSVPHAMTCTNGGYIHRRHDRIRDLFAELIDEVATEVQIEPPLQPLSGEVLPSGANTDDEARLDIAARGFWQECEMAFFDVRVFNPYARSHLNVNLESAFKTGERTKKRHYNDRVIRVEHGTFTPIVFSSCGGMGFETNIFVSKLIEKLSEKKNIMQSMVANYVRTKVSFELIRSQVRCIRGSRSLKKVRIDTGEMEMVAEQMNIRE